MRTRVKKAFTETHKEIQVKFDILSKKFLLQTFKRGSRLMHITSDFFDENYLMLEGDHGVCEKVFIEDLKEILSAQHINIEVVSIALPNSRKIG